MNDDDYPDKGFYKEIFSNIKTRDSKNYAHNSFVKIQKVLSINF